MTGRLLLASALLLAACGSDEPSTPTPPPPAPSSVTAVTTTVTGTPGWLLDDSLAVRVTNAQGQPVIGAKVAWQATVEGAIVRPDTATTDANGIAKVEYAPGWNLGAQPVTARVGEATATVTVTATGMRLTQVARAPLRLCGLDDTGKLWCWMRAGNAARPRRLLGRDRPAAPTTSARFTRVQGVQETTSWTPLCGVTTTNELRCVDQWALREDTTNTFPLVSFAQTNPNVATDPPFPVKDVEIHQRFGSSVCAIDTSDALWCWGRNSEGQFGNGTTQGTSTWVPTAPGMRWRQLSTNYDRSVCGLTVEGQAYCWSTATGPIIGQAFGEVFTTPQPMPYPIPPLKAIAHASNALCGITAADDRLLCWGEWAFIASPPPREPGPLPGLPTTATAIGGYDEVLTAIHGGQVYRYGHPIQGANSLVRGLTGVRRLLTSYNSDWCVEHEGGAVLCAAGFDRPVAVPLPAGP
ncbi:MAG TPA: Ig-like domain-containing protein [Gemmatimonadales bacterium]|nr:Ig-like domain-containing protein [Gemmatimonadales bacterium]